MIREHQLGYRGIRIALSSPNQVKLEKKLVISLLTVHLDI